MSSSYRFDYAKGVLGLCLTVRADSEAEAHATIQRWYAAAQEGQVARVAGDPTGLGLVEDLCFYVNQELVGDEIVPFTEDSYMLWDEDE